MSAIRHVKNLTLIISIVFVFFAVFSASAQTPTEVLGVECSRISELGIDKQENMRAGMIMVGCGLAEGGHSDTESVDLEPFGALTNVNLITEPEIWPHVTQSESMVWSNGNTIVVNYNDSRDRASNPVLIAGISVSTDGGQTFRRLTPNPLTGHGGNFGDPIVVYNARLNTWFAGDLTSGGVVSCGGQGIGLWTSPDGVNWTVGACAHIAGNDDRESMWVDNNPGSPFYGRMYISCNCNFGTGLQVTYSDDGITWSPLRVLSSFVRDVQVTGSLGADGTVFVAAMDEGGMRTNLMFRSTDGGDTWTRITMGAPFPPPGLAICGFFRAIPPIWRYQGWGEPGVSRNGVVHYAYGAQGANPGDIGDVLYTRSADNGDTWSAPIVLNTDQAIGGDKAQWMPSLSVTPDGVVQVYWYDRRNTTDGTNYEVWGRRSPDDGLTWEPDRPISDVLIQQPEQPDPGIVGCYVGDYNYSTASTNANYATWADGRNPVLDQFGNPHFQQDVYFAAVQAATTPSFSVAADPNSLVISQGSTGVSTATVTSTGGFSDPVLLGCAGQPVGVTCDYVPNPVTPPPSSFTTSMLTISVAADVRKGAYDFTITGTSGVTTQTAPFHVVVRP